MKSLKYCLVITALLAGGTTLAQDDADRDKEEARQAYEAALNAAREEQQLAREALERARSELSAVKAAEELARSDNMEAQSRQLAAEREELEAMREELSRVHENLRRASREVAQVHRELDMARVEATVAPFVRVNLGDKAVIGVILGDSTDDGVQILGVSPDGPADRAGIEQGDVIISMMDRPLAEGDADARAVLNEVMDGVEVGDELVIAVDRGDEVLEFVVTADKREPFSWQSIVRLPSAPVAPDAPGAPHIARHIRIPQIDEVELRERMSQIRERMEDIEIKIDAESIARFSDGNHSWEYRFDTLSELGDDVLRETNVWFGLPATRGLKMAEVNEGLGDYFNVEGGVLVISAREDNDLQLQSGDVILQVGDREVSTPADVIRALRDWQPGASVELKIKRDRKNKSLEVEMPDKSLGFDFRVFDPSENLFFGDQDELHTAPKSH